jgi:sugar lactone lactonase YvrE
MAIDRRGNLVLSCPNYADDNLPGVMVRFDKEGRISKWFEVPVHPETGVARNMGIDFDADYNLYICDNQGWSGRPDLVFKGRVLRVEVSDDGAIRRCVTVANGMEHPNGIKVRGDYMYLTQSMLSKVHDKSGKLVSCVYRFKLTDENIEITNTLEDKNIIATFITQNPKCQYGADGIEFGHDGSLYVGNFGDGAVWKITFDDAGGVVSNSLFAQNTSQLKTTDGMCMDGKGNIYVADFSANAIAVVKPNGEVERIAQSPDCDGLDGGLDQPGEPRVWNGKLIVSCFDLVTDDDKVNTAHEMPATLSQLELI